MIYNGVASMLRLNNKKLENTGCGLIGFHKAEDGSISWFRGAHEYQKEGN